MEGGERRERGTKSQRGGEGRREWIGGGGSVPLARDGGLGYLCRGPPSSSYATAERAGLPT